MASSTNGLINVTYSYDHTGQRVKMTNGTDSYIYPNKYFNINNATTTKQIFANDRLIATIEGNGNATSTYYTHSDHLGGSSVITDNTGTLTQTLDYYPFGGIRINEKEGSFDEKRKFTGHEYDDATGLNYMVARYENPTVGRFISQDKASFSIGNDEELNNITGMDLATYLSNPQVLNSYSYANNRPLVSVDPDGNNPLLILAGVVMMYAPQAMNALQQLTTPIGQVMTSFAMDDAKTLTNPNSSSGAKVLAGVGLGLAAIPEAKEVSTVKLTSNEIGKIGEKMMGKIVGQGEKHIMHDTSMGKRFVDLETKSAIHESKNGYISASQKILTQIKKDAEIARDTGKQAVWHLFKGGSSNVINSLNNIGAKVIDYSKKIK